MHRLTLSLALPIAVLCAFFADVHAQDFYYFDNHRDSVPIWTKRFTDSLMEEFELRGMMPPQLPNQPFEWKMPEHKGWQYRDFPNFNYRGLPGIPMPDLFPRYDERNIQPRPRVIPKRPDSKEIPNFRGWRFEKLKNLT